MPAESEPSRPLLVLDVGGVLLVDPIPILFERLAAAGGHPRDEIYAFYKANLRHGFWAGRITEDELWRKLLPVAGVSPGEEPTWRAEAFAWQTPLPAIERLGGWSEKADLEILSNHLSHWVRPILRAAGVILPPLAEEGSGRIRRALISAETGLVKPDARAFRAALEIAPPGGRVLFADDQAVNVAAARAAALPSVLADAEGRWMDAIDTWLGVAQIAKSQLDA